MKSRRILAFLLTLVLISVMLPSIRMEAQAYTAAPTISQSDLDVKIHRLSTLLEGKYFTTTQVSCGNNVCDACFNANVFTATWFKNIFGTVSVDQIPKQAYPYGETGTAAGWTCHGFANFAQWYLFSTSNNDKVTNYRVVDNVMLTRANLLKYAKPGDIIRYTYDIASDSGHSVIFVSANDSNFTVIDCNFRWNGDAKSCVRTHTISYDSTIPMAISRADNYPTASTLTVTYNANGGTPAGNSNQIKTTTPMLRIRASASLSGTILGMIPEGSIVTVQETTDAEGYTWGKVTYEGISGWSALTGFCTWLGYYLEGNTIYQSGDSQPYSDSFSCGSAASLPTASTFELTRSGYRFLGWSTSPDGTGTVFDPAASLKAEDICPNVANSDQKITLYAVWEDLNPTVLTLNFNGKGGQGSMASLQYQKGATVTLPENQFTLSGDTFKGWHVQRYDGLWLTDTGWSSVQPPKLLPDGAIVTLDSEFVTLSGNHSYTFYAQWKNDGITGISLYTAPNKTAYLLNSQFDSAGLSILVHYADGNADVVTGGFAISHAPFSQVGNVTVEISYRGFATSTSILVYEPSTVAVGSVSGYLDEVVTVPIRYISGGSTPCHSLSLTLCYDPLQLECLGYSRAEGIDAADMQVILNNDGRFELSYNGAALEDDVTLVYAHLRIFGDAQTVALQIRDALCADSLGRSYVPDIQNGTVTNRGCITIRYNASQGTNAPADVTLRYGQQLIVSSVIPVREGYTFLGWSLFANSVSASYQAGSVVTFLTDTTLYAVWQQNPTGPVLPTISLSYPTLSFEDQIQYNVYYTLSDNSNIVQMGLITFDSKLSGGTMRDAVEVIPGYWGDGTSFMVHTNGIPAKKLGDALYFKVYAELADGTYIYSDVAGYNAIAYAKTILSSSTTSAKAKALVVAMLNYGAASQTQFGYKTDSLMNSFLTDAGKSLAADYTDAMVAPVVAADSTRAGHFVMNKTAFTGAYPTVSFEGAFSINYYFTTGLTPDNGITFCYWDADTYNSVARLTTANATGKVQMTKDGDRWYASVEGIAAKDMDETIYVAAIYKCDGVTYTTSVIAYSLGKYCQTMAASGNELGAAAAVYGYYAKAYFAN